MDSGDLTIFSTAQSCDTSNPNNPIVSSWLLNSKFVFKTQTNLSQPIYNVNTVSTPIGWENSDPTNPGLDLR